MTSVRRTLFAFAFILFNSIKKECNNIYIILCIYSIACIDGGALILKA